MTGGEHCAAHQDETGGDEEPVASPTCSHIPFISHAVTMATPPEHARVAKNRAQKLSASATDGVTQPLTTPPPSQMAAAARRSWTWSTPASTVDCSARVFRHSVWGNSSAGAP